MAITASLRQRTVRDDEHSKGGRRIDAATPERDSLLQRTIRFARV